MNGSFYLAERVRVGTEWKNKIIRRATEDEIKLYLELREHKYITVYMTCDNPSCDRSVRTTRNRKMKLRTEDPKKGRLEFVYCSKACREKHLSDLTAKG